MEISGMHFEYAGRSSREFGLIMANVEAPRHVAASGKISTVRTYRTLDKRNCFIGTSYTDSPMVFEAEVVSEEPMSYALQREVMKWLFHRDGYKKFFVDMFDDYDCESYELVDGVPKRTYLNCRLINPEKLEYNGGVVGYRFTVECDSHLAWQEPIVVVREIDAASNSGELIEIEVDTDVDDYVYPEIVITTETGCTEISIVNESDDSGRVTAFRGDLSDAVIRMAPSIGFVTDGYYDLFIKKNFVRLLDGMNSIFVSGGVKSVEITWQNMRYL